MRTGIKLQEHYLDIVNWQKEVTAGLISNPTEGTKMALFYAWWMTNHKMPDGKSRTDLLTEHYERIGYSIGESMRDFRSMFMLFDKGKLNITELSQTPAWEVDEKTKDLKMRKK